MVFEGSLLVDTMWLILSIPCLRIRISHFLWVNKPRLWGSYILCTVLAWALCDSESSTWSHCCGQSMWPRSQYQHHLLKKAFAAPPSHHISNPSFTSYFYFTLLFSAVLGLPCYAGYSALQYAPTAVGFSLWWLLLWSMGSRECGLQ